MMTMAPSQTGGMAAIVILTGRSGFTIIAIGFDVAGFPDTHISLEVRTHVMLSPFEGT